MRYSIHTHETSTHIDISVIFAETLRKDDYLNWNRGRQRLLRHIRMAQLHNLTRSRVRIIDDHILMMRLNK